MTVGLVFGLPSDVVGSVFPEGLAEELLTVTEDAAGAERLDVVPAHRLAALDPPGGGVVTAAEVAGTDSGDLEGDVVVHATNISLPVRSLH